MDSFPDDEAENRNDNIIILYKKSDSEAEKGNNSPVFYFKKLLNLTDYNAFT